MNYKGFHIELQRKYVRNIRLSVNRNGRINLAVPFSLKNNDIISFLDSKYDWMQKAIEKQRQREQSDSSQSLSMADIIIFTQNVTKIMNKWQVAMDEYNVKVTIRHMTTRWGSCTPSRRTIRISTLLANKPLELVEYVIVHELAHLKYPNHSQNFWNHVSKFIPDWKTRRKKLNGR